MNKTAIEEELESIISIPRSWDDWDDGSCIRFNADLAKVLASMDQGQLEETRALIKAIAEAKGGES